VMRNGGAGMELATVVCILVSFSAAGICPDFGTTAPGVGVG
jgi:hypothetical protein